MSAVIFNNTNISYVDHFNNKISHNDNYSMASETINLMLIHLAVVVMNCDTLIIRSLKNLRVSFFF